MAKLDVLNLKGEKVNDVKLNDAVFKVESNEVVVAKALKLQLASLRQGTHKTKTRAEVSGGGRKPYKQKGTGNARQGSIRAPHYRHGGIAFGVTPRSYTFKMNKKERVLALRSVLSEKMAELGIGEKAIQQFADTAANILLDVVNPIGDYLEKYENIFDERVYNTEIQSYAKQMFFASQAMKQDAMERPVGQKFVYDM